MLYSCYFFFLSLSLSLSFESSCNILYLMCHVRFFPLEGLDSMFIIVQRKIARQTMKWRACVIFNWLTGERSWFRWMLPREFDLSRQNDDLIGCAIWVRQGKTKLDWTCSSSSKASNHRKWLGQSFDGLTTWREDCFEVKHTLTLLCADLEKSSRCDWVSVGHSELKLVIRHFVVAFDIIILRYCILRFSSDTSHIFAHIPSQRLNSRRAEEEFDCSYLSSSEMCQRDWPWTWYTPGVQHWPSESAR